MALLGALVAIAAVSFVVATAACLWESYWLQPLWILVLVPLGVPAIGFWQFFAFNLFISTLLAHDSVEPKAESAADVIGRLIGRLFVMALRPMVAYALVIWAMGQ